MLDDLRADFRRYKESTRNNTRQGFLNIFYVLSNSPGLLAILNHRYGFWIDHRFENNHILRYFFKAFYILGIYLSAILLKTQIEIGTEIGRGFYVSNKGNCIIGARKIGERCTISHNVTIGIGLDGVPPEIGDDVLIESQSVIYGNITIGNNVVIKKGTVLNRNVPSGSMVQGNPAKIISRENTVQ
jgi:serine O-acetyltransferase